MWKKHKRIKLCCLLDERSRCRVCNAPLCFDHTIEASTTWSSRDEMFNLLCEWCAFRRRIWEATPIILFVGLVIYVIFVPK